MVLKNRPIINDNIAIFVGFGVRRLIRIAGIVERLGWNGNFAKEWQSLAVRCESAQNPASGERKLSRRHHSLVLVAEGLHPEPGFGLRALVTGAAIDGLSAGVVAADFESDAATASSFCFNFDGP